MLAMPAQQPERMTSTLSVRMPRAEMGQLEDTADQLGVDLSYVARRALALGLGAAHREIANAIDNAERQRAANS